MIAFCILACLAISSGCSSSGAEQAFEIPQSAIEDDSSGQVEISGVSARSLAGSEAAGDDVSLNIARLCPTFIETTCVPDAIQIGIDCGMDWMCGIDPCLCGAPDEWGFCACNGLQEVEPAINWTSSDESVVRVGEMFGHPVLIAAGEGDVELKGVVTLPHYASAETTFAVHVGGLTASDVMVIIIGVVVVLVLVVVVVLVVRRARKRKTRGYDEDR